VTVSNHCISISRQVDPLIHPKHLIVALRFVSPRHFRSKSTFRKRQQSLAFRDVSSWAYPYRYSSSSERRRRPPQTVKQNVPLGVARTAAAPIITSCNVVIIMVHEKSKSRFCPVQRRNTDLCYASLRSAWNRRILHSNAASVSGPLSSAMNHWEGWRARAGEDEVSFCWG
jgi:hypothetical protein